MASNAAYYIQPATNILTRRTVSLAWWCTMNIRWTFIRLIAGKNLLYPWSMYIVPVFETAFGKKFFSHRVIPVHPE